MSRLSALLVVSGWFLVQVSAFARPLPKVRVVLASKGVGEAVPALLQGLRLLEDQSLCSPMALTFDRSTAKRLGKAVGEEYNELVLNPNLCITDVVAQREELVDRLKNTQCAVLCFRSDSSAAGSNGFWSLLRGTSSSNEWRSNLTSLIELMEEIGVGSFLLLRENAAKKMEEEGCFLEALERAKTVERALSVVEAASADGLTSLTLSRVGEHGGLLPSKVNCDQRCSRD